MWQEGPGCVRPENQGINVVSFELETGLGRDTPSSQEGAGLGWVSTPAGQGRTLSLRVPYGDQNKLPNSLQLLVLVWREGRDCQGSRCLGEAGTHDGAKCHPLVGSKEQRPGSWSNQCLFKRGNLARMECGQSQCQDGTM